MRVMTVLLVLLALPGAAQGDEEAMRKAKAHFKAGATFQEAGLLDDALAEYQLAYELAPLPELLFNLAQVYRVKGDRQRALDHYRDYLKKAPDGRGAAEASRYVISLAKELQDEAAKKQAELEAMALQAGKEREAKLAAAKAEQERLAAEEVLKRQAAEKAARERALERERAEQAAAAARAAEEARRAEEERQRVAAEAEREATAKARAKAEAERAQGRRGRGLRIAGLAAAGAGAILAGVGGYFGSVAQEKEEALEGITAMWLASDNEIIREGEDAERNMLIFCAAGGAALATGAVLYYLGVRQGREVVVTPATSGDGVGLVLTGAF